MRTGKKAVVLSTAGGEYTRMDGVKRVFFQGVRFLLFAGIALRVFWPKIEPYVMHVIHKSYDNVSPLWTTEEA